MKSVFHRLHDDKVRSHLLNNNVFRINLCSEFDINHPGSTPRTSHMFGRIYSKLVSKETLTRPLFVNY